MKLNTLLELIPKLQEWKEVYEDCANVDIEISSSKLTIKLWDYLMNLNGQPLPEKADLETFELALD
jgi:hypothetical protein